MEKFSVYICIAIALYSKKFARRRGHNGSTDEWQSREHINPHGVRNINAARERYIYTICIDALAQGENARKIDG